MSLEDNAYDSDAVAFKTVDIKSTTITVSGSFTAFQERTWTSVITLSENQDFAYAIAFIDDFVTLDGKKWRTIPTFNGQINTTNNITPFYVLYKINNNVVTFTVGAKDGGLGDSITTTDVDFKYVTYRTGS